MVADRPPSDVTARARIRDAAFELLATRGVRDATLRAIARAADVSPGLVTHHYGSKQGVIEAVQEWVQEVLGAATADAAESRDPAEANERRAAAFEALLVDQPLLRSYIRRMLLEESPQGLEWFARVVHDSADALRRRADGGLARPVDDVEGVAAVLAVMGLGPLLLPSHLHHVLGVDVARWHAALADILQQPLYPPASPLNS